MGVLGKLGPLGVALTVGQSANAARRHWQTVPPASRARLQTLVRQSGGRPSSLSPEERQELNGLVRDLQLGALGRKIATNAAFGRRGLGRRR